MAEYSLPEGQGRTALGDRYTLYTSNLRGTVRDEPGGAGTRALTNDIDSALEDAGLRLDKVIVLPATPAAAPRDRALDEEPSEAPATTATLDVTVGDDEACVLLVEDTTTGELSWIVPDNAEQAGEAVGTRGFVGSLRFTIPLESPVPATGTRGLGADAAAVGKKIKAFFFKVTDAILGPIVHGFAKKWEAKNRPTYTRTYGPADYQTDDKDFPPLDDAGWRRIAQGRALLFVHGTFSTCGAFSALSREVLSELAQRYGGRLFAFNHATLTADPRENAIAFLADVPPGVKLDIDIVCHSRGGLVARQIAALGELEQKLTVRRIVFVGAVNAGTVLADDEHMIELLDRFTTIARFIPQGPARKVVDALVVAVKALGHSLLNDLEGLRAMNPRGAFLKTLNVAGGRAPDYYAIASDFEPKAGTPFINWRRVEDLAVDRIFASAANDLVVPHDGVFARNGAGGFPISDARCLLYGPADGIVHTEFFGDPRTGAQLLEWLEPRAATVTREFGQQSAVEIARVLDALRDQALAALTTAGRGRGLRTRGGPSSLEPGELEALRPHVVNLSEGVFKASGMYSTTPADVDAIVREHIPAWLGSLPKREPGRIVVWAHGGLVGERLGLQIARKHVDWWKRNGVYPIYFVWETGLFDALRSILEAVGRRIPGLGTRDLFDFTTDPLVQEGVRALGGVHVWGAMKQNAALANAATGGATYLAQRLRELADDGAGRGNRRPLEFHAVGHSAGSIFHSWFVPMAVDAGVPAFKSLQLLAPAITIPDFAARLAARIGPGQAATQAILYTMKKSFEEDDSCIRVYRKSLLYLIHHALEPERRTPVLGLDLSLRADSATAALFGLNGASGAPGRVVWSVTAAGDGQSSSQATTHGGFDDDAATMNSVAANVLGQPQVRERYPSGGARAFDDDWPIADEWLEGVDLSALGAPLALGISGGASTSPGAATAAASMPRPAAEATAMPTKVARPGTKTGARRALCVGIDAYPGRNELKCCVRDTETWSTALATAGFELLPTLTDQAATHAEILRRLRELVGGSKRGDVLVFHYSGHGVQVPDTDGDEEDFTEEALVPIDFEDGAFLLDDDLRAVFEQLPDGVNLTAFIDCCHSGTITRMLGRNADDDEDEEGTRSRFLKPTEDWNTWMQAYARFRTSMSGARELVGSDKLRWATFSACLPTEKALESAGNGHFTRNATRLLGGAAAGYTHRAFQDALLREFGERRRQTPQLDCADAWRDLPLLQPLA